MRCFIRFLIIMVFIPLVTWQTSSHAMDAMLGTVISIDFEKGEMYVSTNDFEKILVLFTPDQIFSSILPGKKIRFWGEFQPGDLQANDLQADDLQADDLQADDLQKFNATYIRGSQSKHKHDSTGVRSRLNKGTRRGAGRGNGKYRHMGKH